MGSTAGRLADRRRRIESLRRGDYSAGEHIVVVGMDIAARAGFDPRAGIVLWRKMAEASKGQPPQWLSTHPSHETRTEEIRRNLQSTLPVYARTRGVAVSALPPYRSNVGEPVR